MNTQEDESAQSSDDEEEEPLSEEEDIEEQVSKQTFELYLKQARAQVTPESPMTVVVTPVMLCMINARGFSIHETKETLRIKADLQQTSLVAINDKQQLLVVFMVSKKLTSKIARQLIANIAKYKIEFLIVVTQDGVTPMAFKELSVISCDITFFREEQAQKNYLQHRIVPKQRRLADAEVTQLLTRLKIKRHQLPKISLSDAVVRFNGWPVGSVVESVRMVGRPYKTFRVVIP